MSRVFSVKLGALDLTAYPFMVLWDSLDQGAPENVTEVLESFLQDGDLEVSSRSGNRTLSFTVGIEGANLAALATSEAALIAETDDQQNLLTITPGDGSAPASAFETFRAALTFVRSEAGEDGNLRRYTVTVRALPWARSVSEVTVAATGSGGTPPAPTVVTVDDCTSVTGWARAVDATTGPTVVTGAVTVGWSGSIVVGAGKTLAAERTGLSASMSSTPYLRVTVSQLSTGAVGPMSPSPLFFRINGSPSPVLANIGNDYYFDCTGLTVTSVRASGNWKGNVTGSGTATLRVDDISRTDQIPAVGTARQLQRSVGITGSAPAQATLAIEHATSALGDVIAYVFKNDNATYSPPLRQYRISGGTTTTDSSTVSGFTETLATSPFFDIPVSALPVGLYEALVRVKETTSSGIFTLGYTAQMRVNGVNVGAPQTGTVSTVLGAGFSIVSLGTVNLRSVKVPGNSTATIRVTLSGVAAITFDEGWLFNLDIGTVTRVSCGSAAPTAGGSSNRLWLTPPSLDNGGVPTALRGFAADQSDAFFPDVIDAWSPPVFRPPVTGVFTVTTNALNAAASARYYPRWHTNAAS